MIYFGSQLGIPSQETMVTDTWSGWQYSIHIQEAVSNEHFLFFIWQETLSLWIVLPTFRVGHWRSITLTYKIHYINTYRFDSMKDLNTMKLKIKINLHIITLGRWRNPFTFYILLFNIIVADTQSILGKLKYFHSYCICLLLSLLIQHLY